MENLASEFLFPALRLLQSRIPSQFKVVVIGPAADAFIKAGILVQAVHTLPRAQFIAFVRGLLNPLAVIPLEDSLFASCKSAIKWMEYGEAGIPCLCSAVSPYVDVVDHGVTGGLVANNVDAWRDAITAAIADSDWRLRIAISAHIAVREKHGLLQMEHAWFEAIRLAIAIRSAPLTPVVDFEWHILNIWCAVWQRSVQTIRHANRNRLKRRKARARK